MNREQIAELAHRICWKYKHSSDPAHSSTFLFNETTLFQFAEAIVREAVEAEREHRIPVEITPEDSPENIADLGEEPMNAYADGWNDCVRLAKRMIRARGEMGK